MSKERKLSAWEKVRLQRRQYEGIMSLLTLDEINILIERASEDKWFSESLVMLNQWKAIKEIARGETLTDDLPVGYLANSKKQDNTIGSVEQEMSEDERWERIADKELDAIEREREEEPCSCPDDCPVHGDINRAELRQGRRVRK